jgi:hypothetical protein
MLGYGGDSRHAFSSFPTNRLLYIRPGAFSWISVLPIELLVIQESFYGRKFLWTLRIYVVQRPLSGISDANSPILTSEHMALPLASHATETSVSICKGLRGSGVRCHDAIDLEPWMIEVIHRLGSMEIFQCVGLYGRG